MNKNPSMNGASKNISQILNPKKTELEIYKENQNKLITEIFQNA
jgi:hypothetical protein